MLVIKHKGLCWVVEDKKLCYLHVPKCASTAVKSSANYTASHMDNVPEDFFVFTIIRDPYQRFYSAYQEALKRKDLLADMIGIPKSEKDIMDMISLLESGAYEPHFIPQVKLIGDYEHRISKFIWFDNVGSEISKIYRELGIKNNFINHNVGDESTKQYIRNIIIQSDNLKKKIAELYAQDVEMINRVFGKTYTCRF